MENAGEGKWKAYIQGQRCVCSDRLSKAEEASRWYSKELGHSTFHKLCNSRLVTRGQRTQRTHSVHEMIKGQGGRERGRGRKGRDGRETGREEGRKVRERGREEGRERG